MSAQSNSTTPLFGFPDCDDTMQRTEITINCKDGFKLAGTLYMPETVKAAIMIAPATGIKRQFYNSFARHLCEKGFVVLTFDNRGIGQSIHGSLNDGNPSLTNWGKLDMTAALEHLKSVAPNTDYHLIGHSAGGQLVGLMENALELTSMFNFASSSGSIHYAKYPFKFTSAFFLKFFIPVNNLLFGHTKSQWVGMGEPLPKRVSSDWSRWCSGKGYVKVDLDTKIKDHFYDELTFSTCWVHAEDDEIANDETVKDMIRVFTKAESRVIKIAPKEHGFKDIGHMKFFSSKRNKLWQMALDWLETH